MIQMELTKTHCSKQRKFSITLKENGTNSCSYKVNRKIFDTLKKYLEPFRSLQTKAKRIKCVETGQIFESAREASNWIKLATKADYCDMNLIKQACKGKQKTSYGYHWEWVNEESDRVKPQFNKRKTLKN